MNTEDGDFSQTRPDRGKAEAGTERRRIGLQRVRLAADAVVAAWLAERAQARS